jgi:hypothetical protein
LGSKKSLHQGGIVMKKEQEECTKIQKEKQQERVEFAKEITPKHQNDKATNKTNDKTEFAKDFAAADKADAAAAQRDRVEFSEEFCPKEQKKKEKEFKK